MRGCVVDAKRALTGDDLDAALGVLDAFDLVFFTETLKDDDKSAYLQRRFGAPPLATVGAARSSEKRSWSGSTKLPDDVVQDFYRRNALDLAFYRTARERDAARVDAYAARPGNLGSG